ncbi:unnamed protein product [Acanthoscelides obtectus]|uniref:Uncharacterized protein n=1 Tax=Acanthoscelides obtectus TaxID=200917 RepID=A0A9P0P3H6_ACAOB|nr:unnamed protein product [Acanthoscelides obtectus]CAK1658449.1 hypothetical protein AOBTE_LOCUS20901 [Acanthoscelides obtectus]
MGVIRPWVLCCSTHQQREIVEIMWQKKLIRLMKQSF